MVKILCAAVMGLVILGSQVGARAGSFELALGYSQLNVNGWKNQDLDGDGGAAIRFNVGLGHEPRQGWRIGLGLDFTGNRQEYVTEVSPGFWVDDGYQELFILTPEVTIGYVIPIGNWFIEPRVGIGLAIGAYTTGPSLFYPYFGDKSEWEVFPSIRPGVQVGYNFDWGAMGIEGSCRFTELDFGDGVGGAVVEPFVGVFARFRF